MTVKELIEKLKTLPSDSKVYLWSPDRDPSCSTYLQVVDAKEKYIFKTAPFGALVEASLDDQKVTARRIVALESK